MLCTFEPWRLKKATKTPRHQSSERNPHLYGLIKKKLLLACQFIIFSNFKSCLGRNVFKKLHAGRCTIEYALILFRFLNQF
jgi:hypothetical protein